MNTTGRITWKPTIDKTVTKSGGGQMTDPWIRYNLESEFGRLKAREIQKSGYERILVGVSKENDMILETLGETAKITKNIIEVVR